MVVNIPTSGAVIEFGLQQEDLDNDPVEYKYNDIKIAIIILYENVRSNIKKK